MLWMPRQELSLLESSNTMLRSYTAFDLETTGLNPETNEIIEIGALKVRDGKIVDRFMEFICPECDIPELAQEITGITNEMVCDSRCNKDVVTDFIKFCEDDILIGHNVKFDYSFMKASAVKLGLSFEKKGIDTLKIARKVHKDLESKSLASLCDYYNIVNPAAHRAYYDALSTAKLYQNLAHYFEEDEPGLFKPEMLMYKPKKVSPATKRQLEFLNNLINSRGVELTYDPTSITKSQASRLIDDILSGRVD